MENLLKVGLILDSFQIPAWTSLMLEKIEQGGDAKITLIILNGLSKSVPDEKKDPLIYRLYQKEENYFSRPIPNALEIRDVSKLMSDIQMLRLDPIQNEDGDSYPAATIEQIKDHQLDVLINISARSLRGEVVKAARLGVWFYLPGGPQQARRNPPGFWEVFKNEPVTCCRLVQRVDDKSPERILYQSFSATDPLSVKRNCNRFLWKSASFVPRILKETRLTGKVRTVHPDRTGGNEDKLETNGYQRMPEGIPGNGEFLGLLIRHLFEYLNNRFTKLIFRTQWFILYNFQEISLSLKEKTPQEKNEPILHPQYFVELKPPKPAFWSDPFVVFQNGLYYIFFEEFIYKEKKAHISVMSINEKGESSTPTVALERPYHLSYPFIFEWQGGYYMIPETASRRCIEVYRCVGFPNQWEFYKTLMEPINALDTTLLEYNGKWWMFTNIKENEGASSWDELFLFYSDSPLSTQWISHPRNPIISDVRKARPAGKIFQKEGILIRPSQDSSKGYGYSLNFNKIIVLNEMEYREEVVSTLRPDPVWHGRGLHTFNFDQQMIVLDGKSRRSKFPSLV